MDREAFLRQVRRHLQGDTTRPAQSPEPLPSPRAPARHAGPAGRDLAPFFAARVRELGGDVAVVASRAVARAAIAGRLRDEGLTITCPRELLWPEAEDRWTEDPRRAGFGLSLADWGIADSGTVVLRHHGPYGRAFSLVPPSIGFLLPSSRLTAHLGAALAAMNETDATPPACITLVSGPSHSADIAGIVCTGVHGPGDVRIWLIEDE